jgi:hypothetical protein
MKKSKGPLQLLNLDKSGQTQGAGADTPESHETSEEHASQASETQESPAFATLQKRPWAFSTLFQALLIVLSLVVAAGFVLILLPQPTVDRIAEGLEARHGAARQERIAFLYIGDQIVNDEFHVRGAVRNITSEPIEKLDAAIRFYSHDGRIAETAIVRMDKDVIGPDEIAQFEVVYPDYKMEFARYSVEFKLRQGGIVNYKDMRKTR